MAGSEHRGKREGEARDLGELGEGNQTQGRGMPGAGQAGQGGREARMKERCKSGYHWVWCAGEGGGSVRDTVLGLCVPMPGGWWRHP